MMKGAYPQDWDERKLACKERAGWQCEAVYKHATGEMVRCEMRENEIRWSRHSHRNYVVYLHAVHINRDIENEEPELVCLCPGHHMQYDRQAELRERISQRRRGYQLTTTDTVIAEARSAGIDIEERSDGYYWQAVGTELRGRASTAARAVGQALYQLRIALERVRERERSTAYA